MSETILEGLGEEDLRAALPISVLNVVEALERAGLSWEEVGSALTAAPATSVALKGGAGIRPDLWAAVKSEFREFLCGDAPKYASLRGEWSELQTRSVPLAIASLSGLIGSQIGIAGGIIAPAVIWLLLTALHIGKQALCVALPAGAVSPSDVNSA